VEVRGVGPARRRKSDEVVGEVDEDVHEVPMPERVGVRVGAALRRRVVAVPALHVVAHEDAPPRRERRPGAGERRGCAVEGEVEVGGFGEVGAGGERGELGDWVGDGRRRLGRIERRLPRTPVVFGDGGGVIGGKSHGAEATEEAPQKKKAFAPP
jgi:hypothetical protein